MHSLWINSICLSVLSQVSATIWIPILISVTGVGIVLLTNAFFFGRELETKANKSEVAKELEKKVDLAVFNKQDSDIKERLNNKVSKEVLEIHMKQFKESYGAVEDRLSDIEEKQDVANRVNAENYRLVSNKLSEISTFMREMQKNCDKEVCKVTKK